VYILHMPMERDQPVELVKVRMVRCGVSVTGAWNQGVGGLEVAGGLPVVKGPVVVRSFGRIEQVFVNCGR
jgi:hypothetical protein